MKLINRLTRFLILKNQTAKGTPEHYVYLEFTLVFEANKYTNKHLEKRIRRRFNTGLTVYARHWDNNSGKFKNNADDNSKLIQFEAEFNLKVDRILSNQPLQSHEHVDDGLITILSPFISKTAKKNINASKGLLHYVDKYIDYRREQGTPRGTLKEFITVKNRLTAYEEKHEFLEFGSINLTFADNLIKFLINKEYHPNTVKKTIEILKTILNYYYERKEELNLELTDKFKSKSFGQVKEYNSDPIPLNEIEVELVNNLNLDQEKELELQELEKQIKKEKVEKHKIEFYKKNIDLKFKTLEKTKKSALLQLSTGLRVSDLFRITPANVQGQMIVMKPTKTLNTKENNTIYIPLNSISKKILTEIKFNSSKLKTAGNNYNTNLKELLKLAGIDTEIEIYEHKGKTVKAKTVKKYEAITSHNLRDTFISIAIKKNVPIPVILKATGQSSYEVMKKYIRLENTDMVNYMSTLF